jgi:hypothetical protein
MPLVRTVEHMKIVAFRPQTLNGRLPDLQGVIEPSKVAARAAAAELEDELEKFRVGVLVVFLHLVASGHGKAADPLLRPNIAQNRALCRFSRVERIHRQTPLEHPGARGRP